MGVTGAEQSICACNTECQEFHKIIEHEDTGLVIYCHSTLRKDVIRDDLVGSTLRTSQDVFILQNTKDVKLNSSDIIPALEKNDISCPRCRKLFEHAQKLLQKVTLIDKKNIMSVCDHCRIIAQSKKKTCSECEEVVQKFISTRGEQKDDTKKYFKIWLSKMKHLLKDAIVYDKIKKLKTRAYSDIQIDRLCQFSPLPVREPVVKQMFHSETHKSDTNLYTSEDNLKRHQIFNKSVAFGKYEDLHTSSYGGGKPSTMRQEFSFDRSDLTIGGPYEDYKEPLKSSFKHRQDHRTNERSFEFEYDSQMDINVAMKRMHDLNLRRMIKKEADDDILVTTDPDLHEFANIARWEKHERREPNEPVLEITTKIKRDRKLKDINSLESEFRDAVSHEDVKSETKEFEKKRDRFLEYSDDLATDINLPSKKKRYDGLKNVTASVDKNRDNVSEKSDSESLTDVNSRTKRKHDSNLKHMVKSEIEEPYKIEKYGRGSVKKAKIDSEQIPKNVLKQGDNYLSDEEIKFQRRIPKYAHDKEKPKEQVAKALNKSQSRDEIKKTAEKLLDEKFIYVFPKKKQASKPKIDAASSSLIKSAKEKLGKKIEEEKKKGEARSKKLDEDEKKKPPLEERKRLDENKHVEEGISKKDKTMPLAQLDKSGAKKDLSQKPGSTAKRDLRSKPVTKDKIDEVSDKDQRELRSRTEPRDEIFKEKKDIKSTTGQLKDKISKEGQKEKVDLKPKTVSKDKTVMDSDREKNELTLKTRPKGKTDKEVQKEKMESKPKTEPKDKPGLQKEKIETELKDTTEKESEKDKKDQSQTESKGKSIDKKAVISQEEKELEKNKKKEEKDTLKQIEKIKKDKSIDISKEDKKVSKKTESEPKDKIEKEAQTELKYKIGKDAQKDKLESELKDTTEKESAIDKKDKSKIEPKDTVDKETVISQEEKEAEKLRRQEEKETLKQIEKLKKEKGRIRDTSKEDKKISIKKEIEPKDKVEKETQKELKYKTSKEAQKDKIETELRDTTEKELEKDKKDKSKIEPKDTVVKEAVMSQEEKEMKELRTKDEKETLKQIEKLKKEKAKAKDTFKEDKKTSKILGPPKIKEEEQSSKKTQDVVKQVAEELSPKVAKEISEEKEEVLLSKPDLSKEKEEPPKGKRKISNKEDLEKVPESKEDRAKAAEELRKNKQELAEFKRLQIELAKEKAAALKIKQKEEAEAKAATDLAEKKLKAEEKLQVKDKEKITMKVRERELLVPGPVAVPAPVKEEPKQRELKFHEIKMKRPSADDLILQLVKIRQATLGDKYKTRAQEVAPAVIKAHQQHCLSGMISSLCELCNDSDLEIAVENIELQNLRKMKTDVTEIIIGETIFNLYKHPCIEEPKEKGVIPMLFKTEFENELPPLPDKDILTLVQEEPKQEKQATLAIMDTEGVEPESTKGIIHYALSDRTFIDKGWTMLPTEKVVRKMNVYRMRPAHPEFDWFEHNKNKRLMTYETGEKLAEFDDNGRGRWYYKNGRLALDYYDAEETNAQQRFVLYSSGEPDDRGRSHPITILATFDYLGNGIVFDHSGKIRLKYNQTEGVVLDRGIGPVSHWKWHTLNDPPVLQQVMIDTQMAHKDPVILKLGPSSESKTKTDNEEMLAIEFDNFIKEKSKKLSQKFKPFQIKMKALKINEHFSLKVLDQATIYLIFRDGSANLKLNIGMILDHQEIVDTDTAEVGEVSNSIEHFPARTDSLAQLQRSVANAQRYERQRTERERRLRHPVPAVSADQLTAAASPPLRPPLQTVHTPSGSASTPGYCKCRKPANNLYYNTCLL